MFLCISSVEVMYPTIIPHSINPNPIIIVKDRLCLICSVMFSVKIGAMENENMNAPVIINEIASIFEVFSFGFDILISAQLANGMAMVADIRLKR